MAIIKKDGNFMGLPMNIARGNPIPLDTTAVWYTQTEMENYAKTGATAYVGQVLTLVDETNSTASAWLITNKAGTLVKLAATTASGDLVTDIANLQDQVNGLVEKVGAAKTETSNATGIYKLIEDLTTVVNGKGKVETIQESDSIETVLADDGKVVTVAVKVSKETGNALSTKSDGLFVGNIKVPEYTLAKLDEATAGMGSSYQLKKDGTAVGATIDIPKDLVVKSGSVKDFEAGALPEGVTEAGTYIELTLQNDDNTKIYINVSKLIDIYAGGDTTSIKVNVDPSTHKITATIADGGVGTGQIGDGAVTAAKLAADAVETTKIKDGAVTKAKLATDVTTILDKVVDGTTEQKGIVQLSKVSESETEPAHDEAAKKDRSKAASIGDLIWVYDKTKEAIGEVGVANEAIAKLKGQVSDTSESESIKGAKLYTKEQIKAIGGNTAEAGKFVTAAKVNDEGKLAVSTAALQVSDIPDLTTAKITDLNDVLGNKQDNLEFMTAYNATDNKVATAKDIDAAKAAVTGTYDEMAGPPDHGKDVKTIADSAKYTDSLVTNINNSLTTIRGDIRDNTDSINNINGKLEGITGTVAEAITTAKNDAITTAGIDTNTKLDTLQKTLAGTTESGAAYDKTIKDAYELANTAKNGLTDYVRTTTFNQTVTNLKGQDSDTYESESIKGAKLYTDKEVKALSDKIGNLSNVMNFVGALSVDEGGNITSAGVHGDVGYVGNKEYVFIATNPETDPTVGSWEEFGDLTAESAKIAEIENTIKTLATQETVNGINTRLTTAEEGLAQEIKDRKASDAIFTNQLTWGTF